MCHYWYGIYTCGHDTGVSDDVVYCENAQVNFEMGNYVEFDDMCDDRLYEYDRLNTKCGACIQKEKDEKKKQQDVVKAAKAAKAHENAFDTAKGGEKAVDTSKDGDKAFDAAKDVEKAAGQEEGDKEMQW
jgi:hypothetical protein